MACYKSYSSSVVTNFAGSFNFPTRYVSRYSLIGDLTSIQAHRHHYLINESLRRANMKRRNLDYQVDQQVLQPVPDPDKMQERAIGPFDITRVHCNGTLTIRRSAHVTERINIRRLRPFKQQ
jgi:hypothetical protein